MLLRQNESSTQKSIISGRHLTFFSTAWIEFHLRWFWFGDNSCRGIIWSKNVPFFKPSEWQPHSKVFLIPRLDNITWTAGLLELGQHIFCRFFLSPIMSPGIRIKTFFLDPFDDAYSEEKFPILLTIKFVLSDIQHRWKNSIKWLDGVYKLFFDF